jgi:hypothetical protein
MVGPAVGGLILGLEHGVPAALAAVVLCRLLALAALGGIARPAARGPVEAISVESLVAGVRFVWQHKLILATITLDLFAVLLGGVTALLPVFAKDILHAGPWAVGYLRSAEAAGAIFMAIVLTHLPPLRRAGRTLLWAVAGFGGATIVFGLSRDLWLSLAMMFLVGAFDNVSVVVRHTLVQMLTPDAMRGRVSAVNSVFIVSSNDLGGLESGVTGTILVVLAAAKIWPEIRQIGSLADIRPAEELAATEQVEQELAERG